MYLNLNTNNSINSLNNKGNSGKVVFNKDYELKTPSYTITGEVNLKTINVASFNYVNGERNVIFPYSTKDFTFAGVNGDSAWERKNGILKAIGVTDAPVDKIQDYLYWPKYINTDKNKFGTWLGMGWAMSETRYKPDGTTYEKQIFYPENLIYSENGDGSYSLKGYYNADSIEIQENFNLIESVYAPSKPDFISTDTNNGNSVGMKTIMPYQTSNVLPSIVNVSKDADLYNFLYTNVKKEQHNSYQLVLDINSLSRLQKNMLETVLINQKDSILKTDVVVKDSWILQTAQLDNPDANVQIGDKIFLETKQKVIDSLVQKKQEEILKIFEDNVDKYFELFANKNNIAFQDEKTFSLTDQQTSTNVSVFEKSNNSINKIVYYGGSQLEEVSNFEQQKNKLLLEEQIPFSNRKYLANLLFFMKEAMVSSEEPVDKRIYNKIDKFLKDINYIDSNNAGNNAVNNGDYNYIFSIYNPSYLKTDFITDNNQKIDLKFNYLWGLSSFTSPVNFSKVLPQSYSVVIPPKFLNDINKTYISIEEWNYAKKLKDQQFLDWLNLLDGRYKITINNKHYVIIGTGLSPDMAYPSSSLENLIINSKNETLLYVNELGFKSLLSSAPLSFVHNYYSLIDNKNNKINSLNNLFKKAFNENSTSNLVYKSDDFLHNKNIITFRVFLPTMLKYVVTVAGIVVIVILLSLGFYLSYLLINTYITKNQVQLAVIKANGFSNFKISLALSFFGLFISIIAGSFGYLIAYWFQDLFVSIITPFWYVPINFIEFSAIGFFGGIISLFITFFVFSYLILKRTFRKPINELISSSSEMKVSKALNILKNSKIKMSPILKFRMSLSFCNVFRLVFYTMLCSSGLALVTLSSSLPEKFNHSNYLTEQNKKYAYKFDLITPTEQSGLLKYQKYSELGFSNPSQGIYPIYSGTMNGVYYPGTSKFPYPYKLEDLVVYDPNTGLPKKDEFGNTLHYGNILLPSYNANNSFVSDPNFVMNNVFTKWLFDFKIDLVNLNPWDFIKPSLPPELIAKAETQDQIFLKAIYESENKYIKAMQQEKQYIILDKATGIYKVNKDKVILPGVVSPDELAFTKDFLKFIGFVYGDPLLSSLDVKISFGLIPYDENTESITNVYANIGHKGKTWSGKIVGINPNSKYIQLKDNNLNDISYLLNQENAIIINNGAAYDNKIKIGDTINIEVLNSYFRNSETILNHKINHNFNLKVVGITSTSFGEEYYVSQSLANKLTNMELDLNNQYNGGQIISHYEYKNGRGQSIYLDNKKIKNSYIPFNGIITSDENSFFLSKTISFYSYMGIWPMMTVGKVDDLNKFLDSYPNQFVPNEIPVRTARLVIDKLISNNPLVLNNRNRDEIIYYFENKYNDATVLSNYLLSMFNNTVLNSNLTSFESYITSKNIYDSIFSTLYTIQTLGILMFIPIVTVMILVMTSIMMNDFKKMISILKTLGYSDKENIKSVIFTYIPIILLALIIGIILLVTVMFAFQFATYNVSSIFISSSINWIPYLYGVGALLAIVILNFIFTLILFKRTKLKTTIVS